MALTLFLFKPVLYSRLTFTFGAQWKFGAQIGRPKCSLALSLFRGLLLVDGLNWSNRLSALRSCDGSARSQNGFQKEGETETEKPSRRVRRNGFLFLVFSYPLGVYGFLAEDFRGDSYAEQCNCERPAHSESRAKTYCGVEIKRKRERERNPLGLCPVAAERYLLHLRAARGTKLNSSLALIRSRS